MSKQNFKSGFVSIIGAPNAGKSTLLNRLIRAKISVTSEKAQTTRTRILGIVHRPDAQIVLTDTPGFHLAKNIFNRRMVDAAMSAMSESDAILLITDAAHPDTASESLIVEKLGDQKKPVILALNKIDLIKKPELLTLTDSWSKKSVFQAIVPISARTGEQVEALSEELEKVLPQGEPYFPEDMMTDLPEKAIAAEMVREKVFRLTDQEIPYATAVTVESFDESDPKLIRIHATIHVERDSQKGILIGKNGVKLKSIGEQARKDIERMLNAKVFLKLFVRVEKNWTKDTKVLQRFGY